MARAVCRWFTTHDVPNRHGCQGFVIYVDAQLAKALSHPVRQRILQRLSEDGVASPTHLARALGEPLGNISYHVRILLESRYVELVRTEPRRGALEHFYRATVGPGLDDEQWARLPAAFRRKTLTRTLSEILQAASEASRSGGFDGPEAHVSRAELALDEDGRVELTALLAGTLEAARRIHSESAARVAERAPDAPPAIATELAIMHLRHQTN